VGKVYVDTKYNADAHVKNLMAAVDQLGIEDLGIRIGIAD